MLHDSEQNARSVKSFDSLRISLCVLGVSYLAPYDSYVLTGPLTVEPCVAKVCVTGRGAESLAEPREGSIPTEVRKAT